jgi:hypothetical protein
MMTDAERREAARPVMVRDWMDLFHFGQPAELICPDCDQVSPEVEHIFAAAKWVEKHAKECPA